MHLEFAEQPADVAQLLDRGSQARQEEHEVCVKGIAQRGGDLLVEAVGVEAAHFGPQRSGDGGDVELLGRIKAGRPGWSEGHGGQGTAGAAPEPTGGGATVAGRADRGPQRYEGICHMSDRSP